MGTTHAGAVAFREPAGAREYLLVSSSKGGEWVLPKGHIERSESVSVAALRELMEESGVQGTVVAELKPVAFRVATETVEVSFLLVRSDHEGRSSEKRQIEWLAYQKARARLDFEEQRGVLDEAEQILVDRYQRKVAFLRMELRRTRDIFDSQSSKHKRMYRYLRYPAIILTALSGALAALALAFTSLQWLFNLMIVSISAILTVLVAFEALRKPRELWIHERSMGHTLEDLLRHLNYRALDPAGSEDTLDAIFSRLQSTMGSSGERWQEFARQQQTESKDKTNPSAVAPRDPFDPDA